MVPDGATAVPELVSFTVAAQVVVGLLTKRVPGVQPTEVLVVRLVTVRAAVPLLAARFESPL